MTFFSCELRVEQVLGELPRVVEAEASTINQNIGGSFDAGHVGVEELGETMNAKIGYRARLS